MGLIIKGLLGARKLLGGRAISKGIGEFIRDSRLNPGSYAEDILRGLGARTRTAPVIGRREVLRDILDKEGNVVLGKGSMQSVLGDKQLNAAGWAAQLAGLGAAGTLGYRMFGHHGDEPAVDANGVKNPAHNEEIAKIRSKYQAEKMGGSKMFSQPILEHASKDSQWVKTAIDMMGVEKYKQLRKAAIADPAYAEKLHHELVSNLARTGDEEAMKQAGSDSYVLPGLARVGDEKKVIVMNPIQGKDKKTRYAALPYDYQEEEEKP